MDVVWLWFWSRTAFLPSESSPALGLPTEAPLGLGRTEETAPGKRFPRAWR
jgi:hypothetical protein